MSFGLCDKPHPAKEPAYINESDQSLWIGIVRNPQQFKVEFFAIDHCVDLLRADKKQSKRCDGLLRYKKNLVFVELKDRRQKGSKWLKEGIEQLIATIDIFKEQCGLGSFDQIEAYVCNRLKPLANQGHASKIQAFKNDTGIILKPKQLIEIKA